MRLIFNPKRVFKYSKLSLNDKVHLMGLGHSIYLVSI